jgi:lipopolysaccharide export system ATP-binding protein
MLEARALTKRYGQRTALDKASLIVQAGEVVGLLGANGAGKTTCFYLIVGLLAADSGQLSLDGRDLTPLAMHQRARLGLGYLPQEPSVFRRMSVADNLLAVLELRSDLNRKQQAQRCDALLDELRIDHLRAQQAVSLSGGERRRLEIARALALQPRFMLLDEPFAGVDPIAVGDIQRIIQQLRAQGIGVLITDHKVRETLASCDRAYIINAGRIIAEGDPGDIVADDAVREAYLGQDFRL